MSFFTRLNEWRCNFALRRKVWGWRSGQRSFSDYEALQLKGSAFTREAESNQKYIRAALDQLIAVLPDVQARILDAGCGDGWTMSELRARGYTHLSGIDLHEGKIEIARSAGHANVKRAVLPDLDFSDASFDAVFCRHVFEHLLFPSKTLDTFFRILAPGGLLFLIAPKSHIGTDGSEAHVLDIRDLSQLKRMAERAGFEVVQTQEHDFKDHEFWIVARKPRAAKGLRSRTIRGIRIVGALQAVRWLISVGSSVVMYHLLQARDFGLFSLCETYLLVMTSFADMGMSQVAIQRKGEDEEVLLASAFFVRCLFAVSAYILLLLVSAHAGFIQREKDLAFPLSILALTLLIEPASFKSETSLKRRIHFQKFIGADLSAALFTVGLSILLAFLGLGYWSLVIASVASSIARAIVLNFSWPEPFLVPWKWKLSRELVKDGFHVFLTSLLFLSLARMSYFFVGTFLGIAALGYFSLAFNWANVFVNRISQVVSQVVFPAASSVSDEKERIKKIYGIYLQHLSFFAGPFYAVLIVLGPELIPFVLGGKWRPAVPVFQTMCLYGYLRSLSAAGYTVLQSQGDFRKIVQYLSAEVGLSLVLFYPMLRIAGMIGVSLVMITGKSISVYLISRRVAVKFGHPLRQDMTALLPSTLSCLIMAGAMVLIGTHLPPMKPLFHLIVAAAGGIPVYLLSYAALSRKGAGEIRSLLADLGALIGR